MCFICRARRARANVEKQLAAIRGPGAALLDMTAVAEALSEARITLAEIESAATAGHLAIMPGAPAWLYGKESDVEDLVTVPGQHEGPKTLQ